MSVDFSINGKAAKAQAETDTPLLWVIRDELGLTGTKFGCGIAACGACTVHVDGKAIKSCTALALSLDGAQVTTIEGLAHGDALHPMQEAFREHQDGIPVAPGKAACGRFLPR